MTKRLTKWEVGKVMSRIERNSKDDEALEAGAQMLGHEIDVKKLSYWGDIYSDRDELIDQLLINLGNKQRSI